MFNRIFITIIILLVSTSQAFAARTNSTFLDADVESWQSLNFTGGTISSTISCGTGNLITTIRPTFRIRSNIFGSNVRVSVASNTLSGFTNAIFDTGGGATKYVILTNSDDLPPLSSVTNIKTSPTILGNPNAIAYEVLDPDEQFLRTNVTYDDVNDYWNIEKFFPGTANSDLEIPSGPALSNTFGTNDASGDYEATITISFI